MNKRSRYLNGVWVACFLLALAGCNRFKPWDKQLIGSWYGEESKAPVILVFQANGAFIVKSVVGDLKGGWEVADHDKRHVSYWFGSAGAAAKKPSEPMEVTVNGDKLTVRYLKIGSSYEYTRVPDGASLDQLTSKLPKPATAPPAGTAPGETSSAQPGPATPAVAPAPTPTPTRPAGLTDAERDYIEMYHTVAVHFGEADKAIMRYPADPIDVVLDDAARHVDDARKVQDSYPNVPARFTEADATLREGLRKWREGLDTLRYQHSKDDLMVGEQLIARAQIQMKRAAGMPLGGGDR